MVVWNLTHKTSEVSLCARHNSNTPYQRNNLECLLKTHKGPIPQQGLRECSLPSTPGESQDKANLTTLIYLKE